MGGGVGAVVAAPWFCAQCELAEVLSDRFEREKYSKFGGLDDGENE
jgi:hypothetical protein